MAEFYITQEKAFAPGVAGEWPNIIPKSDNPNGRLVRIDGAQALLEQVVDELYRIHAGERDGLNPRELAEEVKRLFLD